MAKKKAPVLTCIADADAAMREIKDLTLRKEIIEREAEKLKQSIDDKLNEQVEPINALLDAATKDLQEYVMANKPQFEAPNPRCRVTPYGEFGLRTTPPAIVLKVKKIADVVAAMMKRGKKFALCVETKHSLKKDAVKGLYDARVLTDRDLENVGLAIQGGEAFVCEISRTETN